MPVLAQRAVDVGRIDDDEPGRLPPGAVLAPDDPILGGGVERILVAAPRDRHEAGEERAEIRGGGHPGGQARDGVPRAGRLGHRTAHGRTHERVGDEALARVRAAAHRRHDERPAGGLCLERSEERAVPGHLLRGRRAERRAERHDRLHHVAQRAHRHRHAGHGLRRRARWIVHRAISRCHHPTPVRLRRPPDRSLPAPPRRCYHACGSADAVRVRDSVSSAGPTGKSCRSIPAFHSSPSP